MKSKIQYKNNQWKFDSKVCLEFDSHVRKNVPFYEYMHGLVKDISAFFITKDSNVYDLGCSTGFASSYLSNNKKGNVIGIDEKEDMINIARNRVKNATFYKGQIIDYKYFNSSFALSFLTAHFIKHNERDLLIKNVYSGLNEGGAFCLVEKIFSESPRIQEIFNGMLLDFKIKNGFSYEETIKKNQSLRGCLIPRSIDQNIKSLKDAGFKEVDSFFRVQNFVGLIAIK